MDKYSRLHVIPVSYYSTVEMCYNNNIMGTKTLFVHVNNRRASFAVSRRKMNVILSSYSSDNTTSSISWESSSTLCMAQTYILSADPRAVLLYKSLGLKKLNPFIPFPIVFLWNQLDSDNTFTHTHISFSSPYVLKCLF